MINLTLDVPRISIQAIRLSFQKFEVVWIVFFVLMLSVGSYLIFSAMGLTLAYNDARSHLDIGRRVVEGLKPGMAQLGSVWLPLPHILMTPTIWNDYMWHSGLSGSLQSMVSFIATTLLIRSFLQKLGVGSIGQIVGILVFVLNLNILYLQSTAMTELLLIGTMMAACYEFLLFYKENTILSLVKSSIWVMLSTLIRYDGWFLFFFCAVLVIIHVIRNKGSLFEKIKRAEGMFILFSTLAGFGVFLWLLWNAVIFKDPLYFAFGPYSAHAQQDQLATAGVLITKHNLALSAKTYWYAMAYNSGAIVVVLAAFSSVVFFLDKKISKNLKIAVTALFAPLIFNILALYLGHSVLFVQGINGDTWFNVRYGIMMMPSIAIFLGYFVWRYSPLRIVILGILLFVYTVQITRVDAVTIDDGRVGSSQKNVSQVAGWLEQHAKNEKGFVLISAASHDAIIFSSQLPMKRFIHEGTGSYWTSATTSPDRWARWIVMRTNDENDQTFKLIKKSGQLYKYDLVDAYPFADVYQLKDIYLSSLITDPTLPRER